MIVDLNEKKFSKAKKGDIFVIEIIDEKKVAVPITKAELLKCEIETMGKLQEQINELKETNKKQNETLKNQNITIKDFCDSLYKFIKIMNGGNDNEETI